MHKSFRLLAAAAAVAAVCSAAAQAEQCQLSLWEDIQKTIGVQDAINAFEKDTGCKVAVQEMPYTQQLGKLRLDGPAGIGPDVLLIPREQLGVAVVQGLIAPVKGEPADTADYTKNSLEAFTADGQLYAYPKVVETIVMYYNKDKLAQPLDSLQGYYDFSKKITDSEKNSYGLLAKFDEIYYAYGVLAPYGGYIFGKDAEGNYDVNDVGLANDGAVEAVTFLTKFYKDGVFPAGIIGENGLNAIDSLFTEQHAAAVITGPWSYEPYKKAGVNFGVTPLPKLPNGKDMSSLLGVKGYALSSWVRDADLAEKFITQYLNKPEFAKKRFEITREIPPLKSVMADPVIANDELAHAVVVQSERAEPTPSIPEMESVWKPIDAALQLSMSGKQDPKSALSDAKDEIASQIEAFRSGF